VESLGRQLQQKESGLEAASIRIAQARSKTMNYHMHRLHQAQSYLAFGRSYHRLLP